MHVSEHTCAECLHCTIINVCERVLKHRILTLHDKCRFFSDQFDTNIYNSDFFRKSRPDWEHCVYCECSENQKRENINLGGMPLDLCLVATSALRPILFVFLLKLSVEGGGAKPRIYPKYGTDQTI